MPSERLRAVWNVFSPMFVMAGTYAVAVLVILGAAKGPTWLRVLCWIPLRAAIVIILVLVCVMVRDFRRMYVDELTKIRRRTDDR